jgi:hypothetical protein
MIVEQPRRVPHGLLALPLVLLALALGLAAILAAARARHYGALTGSIVAEVVFLVALFGFFMVAPNEGKVLQLFGAYRGTVRAPGLRWANPFYTKTRVSLRVRNFESEKLKVNDLSGNPIQIATVVVWRVVDTAEALFEVDDYEHFVRIQTESAVRNLAMHHPYDQHVEGEISLRSHADEIAGMLKGEIQSRLSKAGVEVMEARISHLAYAPEIASVMLQRQQANAIIAARSRIVEGAVGMVEMALDLLSSKGVVALDEERKAAMVSNLLVVLCGDRGTQAVINTGTLHQ